MKKYLLLGLCVFCLCGCGDFLNPKTELSITAKKQLEQLQRIANALEKIEAKLK